MKYLNFIPLIVTITFFGCATPPEVKLLSVKQENYFDAVIDAVKLQSEALVIASEKLVVQTKKSIDEKEAGNKKNFEKEVANGTKTPEEAAEIVRRLTSSTQATIEVKQKLDKDLELIRTKTEELNAFIKKMKDVHLALDAYIQSEKTGETMVQDVLNQPSVSSFISSINDLTPKIQGSINDISQLMSNF